MPLFQRKSDEQKRQEAEAAQLQQASQAALAQGGIPLQAQRRLDELRGRGGGFFTSDLTVDEFVLAGRIGFHPLTQVMGSSVYHVGWQPTPGSWGSRGFNAGGFGQELTVVSRAMNQARALALGRLTEEARRAGANVVIGVHITRSEYDWGSDLVEFNAVGTAARFKDAPAVDHPAVTNLSGQDFWKLFRSGFWPMGVVAASTVYYVVAGWQNQWANSAWGGWANQELGDFTQGLYAARHLAMSRVREQAQGSGAQGIVGMDIEQREREHEVELGNDQKRKDMIVTFHVMGTALKEMVPKIPAIHPVLDLRAESSGASGNQLRGSEKGSAR